MHIGPRDRKFGRRNIWDLYFHLKLLDILTNITTVVYDWSSKIPILKGIFVNSIILLWYSNNYACASYYLWQFSILELFRGFFTATNMLLTSTQFQKVSFWHLHVLWSEGLKLKHILLFFGSNGKNFAKHVVFRSHKLKLGNPYKVIVWFS